MVSVMSLWMPILLSAVAVFLVSWIIHMVLGYHKNDFARVPDEAKAQDALRPLSLAPGDYRLPYAGTSAEMKDPGFLERLNRGPKAIVTVLPPGMPSMGPFLGKWFVFCVVVSLFAAYVAGVVVPPNAEYLTVFRVTGTVAFAGYSLGVWPTTIWYGRSTSASIKTTFDGLIFGLFTGGVFGWLWPS
ncbi:MAG: hypothetical protein ACT4P7_08150 [Gemmatimonadaceae bacterium]